MKIDVGVKALLCNEQGAYLFVKRSEQHYSEVGKDVWDIVGGRIDSTAGLLDNLKREAMEEAQLPILGMPELVGAQDIMDIPNKPDYHVVRLTYVARTEGSPTLSIEHSDYAWLQVSEIKALGNTLCRFVRALLQDGGYARLEEWSARHLS